MEGKNKINPNYDAFLYAERNIYRPGETINANSIIRSYKWETTPEMPVVYKLKSPSGSLITSVSGSLDKQGSLPFTYSLPREAMTGTYQLELFSGADELIEL